MDALAGKPIHHLQKLRTVHMDWLRRCPQGSVDPDHYDEDGQCFCSTKVTKITQSLLKEPNTKVSEPPRTIISVIMRPPPGRNQVRH